MELTFQKLYQKIIKQNFNCKQNNVQYYMNLVKPKEKWFTDTYTILSETIKAIQLTPIPDEVLYQFLKKSKKLKTVWSISYQQIIDIIKNSEYQLSEIFINSLNSYSKDISGHLYILFFDPKNKEQTLNSVYSLKGQIQEERFNQVMLNLSKNLNANGLTIIKKNIQIQKYKDCFIYINKSNNQWKDTLQHQFKHFIQRVCSFDQNLPKVYQNNNLDITTQVFKYLDQFCNINNLKEYIFDLYDFCQIKLDKTQQHQTISSLIKYVIRTYENDKNKYLVNHKFLTISQIQNTEYKLNFRLQWLNLYINNINTYKDFKNCKEFKEYLNGNNLLKQKSKNYLMKILYLVLKNCYKNYDIDKLLQSEFKLFIFRGF